MYAIKKGSLYVSLPGRGNSYTNKLEYAYTFKTEKKLNKTLAVMRL